MDALTALTNALASLDGVEPLKGHRLRARRLILALQDRGFDVGSCLGAPTQPASATRSALEAQ